MQKYWELKNVYGIVGIVFLLIQGVPLYAAAVSADSARECDEIIQKYLDEIEQEDMQVRHDYTIIATARSMRLRIDRLLSNMSISRSIIDIILKRESPDVYKKACALVEQHPKYKDIVGYLLLLERVLGKPMPDDTFMKLIRKILVNEKAFELLSADEEVLEDLAAQMQAIEVIAHISVSQEARDFIATMSIPVQTERLCNVIQKYDGASALWLIHNGVEIHSPLDDGLGLTPLMRAVREGKSAVVEALLKRNVLVNQRNQLGDTALDCTVDSVELKAALAVRRHEMGSGSRRDDTGDQVVNILKRIMYHEHRDNPLAYADTVIGRYAEIIQKLIKSGADTEHPNSQGYTISERIDPYLDQLCKTSIQDEHPGRPMEGGADYSACV